ISLFLFLLPSPSHIYPLSLHDALPILPPQWRAGAYAAALVFGSAIGLLRMAAGAHFFSDVVFAGVFAFLVIWIAHGWQTHPQTRSEEHTSELQSRFDLVCRLLLEKKNK